MRNLIHQSRFPAQEFSRGVQQEIQGPRCVEAVHRRNNHIELSFDMNSKHLLVVLEAESVQGHVPLPSMDRLSLRVLALSQPNFAHDLLVQHLWKMLIRLHLLLRLARPHSTEALSLLRWPKGPARPHL